MNTDPYQPRETADGEMEKLRAEVDRLRRESEAWAARSREDTHLITQLYGTINSLLARLDGPRG